MIKNKIPWYDESNPGFNIIIIAGNTNITSNTRSKNLWFIIEGALRHEKNVTIVKKE